MTLVSNRRSEPVIFLSLMPTSAGTAEALKSAAVTTALTTIQKVATAVTAKTLSPEAATEKFGFIAEQLAGKSDPNFNRIEALVVRMASETTSLINGGINEKAWHEAMLAVFAQLQSIHAKSRKEARDAEEAEIQKQRVDITHRIESFSFEDCDDKADKVSITLHNPDLTLLDHPMLRRGCFLEVRWGYPGNMSPAHRCVIQRVRGFDKLTVEALSTMAVLHAARKTRTFEGMSRGEVARKIAEEYGYGPEQIHIDPDLERINESSLTQSGLTDAEFLRKISGKGVSFYIDPDGFHFRRRNISQNAKRAFTWFTDRRGELLSVSIDYDTTKARGKGQKKIKGIDPLTKEEIEATSEEKPGENQSIDPNTNPESNMSVLPAGLYVDKYDPEHWVVQASTFDIGPTPEDNKEKAQQKVNEAGDGERQEILKLNVEILGDPTINAKRVYEFRGISKTYSGDYYAKQVTHKIGSGGYTITMSCIKPPATLGKKGTGDKTAGDDGANKDPTNARLYLGTFDDKEYITWTGGDQAPPFAPEQFHANMSPNLESGKYEVEYDNEGTAVGLRSKDGSEAIPITPVRKK